MINYFTKKIISRAICYVTKCYLNFGQIWLAMYIGSYHVLPYAESTVTSDLWAVTKTFKLVLGLKFCRSFYCTVCPNYLVGACVLPKPLLFKKNIL